MTDRSLVESKTLSDQVIEAATAGLLQAEARQIWRVVGWVVTKDQAAHAGQFVARFLTGRPSSYVLLDATLAGLHAQLPPGLARQALPPSGALELWFAR